MGKSAAVLGGPPRRAGNGKGRSDQGTTPSLPLPCKGAGNFAPLAGPRGEMCLPFRNPLQGEGAGKPTGSHFVSVPAGCTPRGALTLPQGLRRSRTLLQDHKTKTWKIRVLALRAKCPPGPGARRFHPGRPGTPRVDTGRARTHSGPNKIT